MPELGAGGGQGDLDQHYELELNDASTVAQLKAICALKLQDRPELAQNLMSLIDGPEQSIALDAAAIRSEHPENTQNRDDLADLDGMPVEQVVAALTRMIEQREDRRSKKSSSRQAMSEQTEIRDGLPKRIVSTQFQCTYPIILAVMENAHENLQTFPYSRHSSYTEMCCLIEAFRPLEIYPCTVDDAAWTAASSISFLFGHLYPSNQTFKHDQKMLRKTSRRLAAEKDCQEIQQASPTSTSCQSIDLQATTSASAANHLSQHQQDLADEQLRSDQRQTVSTPTAINPCPGVSMSRMQNDQMPKVKTTEGERLTTRNHTEGGISGTGQRPTLGPLLQPARKKRLASDMDVDERTKSGSRNNPISLTSSPSGDRAAFRLEAYEVARGGSVSAWLDIGLVSVSGHQEREKEL